MNEQQESSGGPKQSPIRGRLYQIVGIIGAIVIVTIVAVYIPDSFNKSLGWLALFVAFAFFIAFFKWGKRHLVPKAAQVLADDTRPPILYLRSFAEEASVTVEEEDLADMMQEVGPFIAIGRPEDELPPLGAARFWVADDDWQGFIKNLLEDAALVLVMAGKTEGLNWELRQCRHMIDPLCLAILIPAREEDYSHFRNQVESETDILLPNYPDKRTAPYHAGKLCGLIYFDENWKGYFLAFEKAWFAGSRPEFPYKTTRRKPRLRGAMRRICERAGLDLQPPEFNLPLLAAFVLIFLGLGVMIFMIYYAIATGAL